MDQWDVSLRTLVKLLGSQIYIYIYILESYVDIHGGFYMMIYYLAMIHLKIILETIV